MATTLASDEEEQAVVDQKVFCIGSHRTGTTSLRRAFGLLGLRCKGFDRNLLEDYHGGRLWRIFGTIPHYDAFKDWPWPLLYRQLSWLPNAKFVFTLRDTEDWIESVRRWAAKTGPNRAREVVYGHPMPEGHERHYIRIYEDHNKAVLSHFAASRDFLVMNVTQGDGWEPLCGFLNLPVPDKRFPHRQKQQWRRHKHPNRESG